MKTYWIHLSEALPIMIITCIAIGTIIEGLGYTSNIYTGTGVQFTVIGIDAMIWKIAKDTHPATQEEVVGDLGFC